MSRGVASQHLPATTPSLATARRLGYGDSVAQLNHDARQLRKALAAWVGHDSVEETNSEAAWLEDNAVTALHEYIRALNLEIPS